MALESKRFTLSEKPIAFKAAKVNDQALERILELVAREYDWEFAEIWVPVRYEREERLVCSEIFYALDDSKKLFRQQSFGVSFSRGVGLAGHAWASREPQFIPEIEKADESFYLRKELASQAGFKSALAIPIISGEEVILVLTFHHSTLKAQESKVSHISEFLNLLGEIIINKVELRRSSSLFSQLIGTVTHELQVPLTVVFSSAELLTIRLREFTEPSSQLTVQKCERLIEKIKLATNEASNFVRDSLTLTSGGSSAGRLLLESIDLTSEMSEIVEEIRQISLNEHIVLSCSGFNSCKKFQLDRRLLRRIFINLLSNAVKYSPLDSTVLLHIHASDEERKITFRLQDQGIGIPSEDLPQLFDPFHRAGNVGSKKGTGLGLAIVRQAVTLHQGEIQVASTVGIGTTFTVVLPIF